MSRLKEQYQNEIVDAMIKKFGYKNIMEVPKLDKGCNQHGCRRGKRKCKGFGVCNRRYGKDRRTESGC